MGFADWQIILTRAAHQCEPLASRLEQLGAKVVFLPCIDIHFFPQGILNLEKLIATRRWNWIVFTSQNAVKATSVAENCSLLKASQVRVAAVGKKTAECIKKELGLSVQCMPDKQDVASLVHALGDCRGQYILLPQGNLGAASDTRQLFETNGASIESVVVYETRCASFTPLPALKPLQMMTFFSPSAIDGFQCLYGNSEEGRLFLQHSFVACIGNTTARKAAQHRLRTDVVPDCATQDAFLETLQQFVVKLQNGCV